MTIRHLKIFLSVCENSFHTTKAAEELHMTQPAVSLAIKELEQHYGVILFDRIGRRLKITEAGQRLMEYSSHIISLFDDMEKGMKDWDSFGIIRIGASITIGSQFLPNYVKAFYNRFPGTEVNAVIGSSELLEQKIINNELDLALIEGVPHSPSLVAEEYMEDHLSVICPAIGYFYQGKQFSIDEFRRQKFLLREHGSGTRETFDRTIEAAGFSIVPAWEAMSTTALVNAVINGLGITVLPYRMVIGPLEHGLIVSASVEGLSFKRKYQIIYHREKYLTSSAKAFIDLCRNYEMDYPLPRYNSLY